MDAAASLNRKLQTKCFYCAEANIKNGIMNDAIFAFLLTPKINLTSINVIFVDLILEITLIIQRQ